jgi:hypothetical protein
MRLVDISHVWERLIIHIQALSWKNFKLKSRFGDLGVGERIILKSAKRKGWEGVDCSVILSVGQQGTI